MVKVVRNPMESLNIICRGCVLYLLVLCVSGSASARDPFWPLGYEGRPVVKSPGETTKPKVPTPDLTPRKRVVTDEDWVAARKLIQMTGFASAGGRQIAFMNGKSYRHGEKLTFTNDGILFTWRVEITGERKADLIPVEAVVQ
jgi:hypothetical protein